jgi:Endonuclease/Exonuclease/phosphatase family 2/RhoGAP domain
MPRLSVPGSTSSAPPVGQLTERIGKLEPIKSPILPPPSLPREQLDFKKAVLVTIAAQQLLSSVETARRLKSVVVPTEFEGMSDPGHLSQLDIPGSIPEVSQSTGDLNSAVKPSHSLLSLDELASPGRPALPPIQAARRHRRRRDDNTNNRSGTLPSPRRRRERSTLDPRHETLGAVLGSRRKRGTSEMMGGTAGSSPGLVLTIRQTPQVGVDPDNVGFVDDTKFGIPAPALLVVLRNVLSEASYCTEGVFRLGASVAAVERVEKALASSSFSPFLVTDVHVAATLIKRWYGALPVRILDVIPREELTDRLQVASTDMAQAIEIVRDVSAAKPIFKTLFVWLLRLIVAVSEQSDKNLMSSENLSIVFGPQLLRAGDSGADLLASMDLVKTASEFLNQCVSAISHEPEVFGAVEDVLPRVSSEQGPPQLGTGMLHSASFVIRQYASLPSISDANEEDTEDDGVQPELEELPPLVASVFVGTWNMMGQPMPDDVELDDFIPPNKHDIYAIGAQECERSIAKSVVIKSKGQWEQRLIDHLGEDFVLLRAHILGAIYLGVFVRKSIMKLVSGVQSGAVACGLANIVNNKGGVGVSFLVGDTSFLFVTAHFTAHIENVEARNADFFRINQELNLSSESDAFSSRGSRFDSRRSKFDSTGSTASTASAQSSPSRFGSGRRRPEPASERFDRVFWCGDLNYRLNGNRRMVESLIDKSLYEVLVANDQLNVARSKPNPPFAGFAEGDLAFPPTYKFDPNTDTYDSSVKQRVPSWTDRVLYKPNERVTLARYGSSDLKCSDHRPVSGDFLVGFDVSPETAQLMLEALNAGDVDEDKQRCSVM